MISPHGRGLCKYSTNAIHKECNILKLIDLYEFKILKFMHNLHYNKGKLPSVFEGYFEKMKVVMHI